MTYLEKHLGVLEQHLAGAMADLARVRPEEPLSGLIAALSERLGPHELPKRPAAVVKGKWSAAEWLAAPDITASLAATLLPQPADDADDLETVRNLGRLGPEELKATLQARLITGAGALASLLASKMSVIAAVDAATGEELHHKFSDKGAFELKHLDLSAFFAGLELMIGAPSPGSMDDVLDAMEAEHLQSSESHETFNTTNYGVATTSATEWKFVVEPMAPPEGGWPFETKNTEIEDDSGALRSIKRAALGRDELLQRMQVRNEKLNEKGEPVLIEPELIAARAYTGPLFFKYNGVLRGLDTEKYNAPNILKNNMIMLCCPRATFEAYIGTVDEGSLWKQADGTLSYAEALKDLNKYTTTLHCINSAIVKAGKLTNACVVYRGVSGGKLPDSFWEPDEYGCCGGVEPGFMSTTQSMAVATGYASGQLAKAGIVYESVLGMTNRGADVSWISQCAAATISRLKIESPLPPITTYLPSTHRYPHEREILMGPLTCLEMEGTRPEGGILVVKAKLSVNLSSPTIERVIGKMKASHLDLLRILRTKLSKVSATAANKLQDLEEEANKLSVDFYNSAEAYKERTNLALDVKGRLEFEEQYAEHCAAASYPLVFGSLKDLYSNLAGVLPPPPTDASDEELRRLMEAEHCAGPDHDASFEVYQPECAGHIHTSPEVEWWYVVDPTAKRLAALSLAPPACASGGDPAKHGGDATPGVKLRLPAWPSEAHLPPFSTGEAMGKTAGAGAPPRAFETPRPLSDFKAQLDTLNAQLTELGVPPVLMAEVIAMRLFTGPMGKSVYNVALRALCGLPGWFTKVFEDRMQQNRYATTIHCSNRGLLKLGKVCKVNRVWRSVSGNTMVPRSFLEPDKFGITGGVEYAPGGTSSKESVAVRWAQENKVPCVLEFEVGVDRPAETAWLSDYPDVGELTMPCFTYLEVQRVRVQRDFTTADGHFHKGSVLYIDISPQFGTI